jgi:hypothetical protein
MVRWKVKSNKGKNYRPVNRKDGPDAVDRAIFRLLSEGRGTRAVADVFDMAEQTMARRINWCKAHRWATFDGRLLTPAERVVLIEQERQQFGRKGGAA